MNYMDKYNEWRNNPYFDKETKEELLNLEGNEKEIEDYHRHGVDVNTWTVNNEDIKNFLSEAGVKTIITNRDI